MADKPPAEKLPLAVRKNVRDNWEAKKAGFESEVSAALGVPWTFAIDPLTIFPYAEENSYGYNSLGSCITSYVEGAISQIKRYTTQHGESGKKEINTVCSTHSITLKAGTGFSYCGCKFEDGILVIVFGPTYLGTNTNDALYDLAKAVSTAPQPSGAPTLSFAARHAVEKDYTPKIGAVLEEARKLLQNPKLEFEIDFDEMGKMLKGGEDVRDDWERNLGNFAVLYFESFVSTLKREKFDKDEMLREGFEEGIPKMVVQFRLVEKLSSGYSEILLEDGKLVMQTVPRYYGTNVSDIATKLVDKL